MIPWWWLLAAFAAGWVLRSVRTQAQLLRLGWDHARETQAWAVECTRAWRYADQLEDERDQLEHERDELAAVIDRSFDDQARELGL